MRKTRTPLFTSAEIRSVREPIERALTLPARAYIDENIFKAEVERIFMPTWTALCFAHTLPAAGDARPVELFGIPLIMVRGHDECIRVFHNICPYDGCPVLLTEQSKTKELVTLYHGWTYDLEGRLVRLPYWNGQPEPPLSALGKRPRNLAKVRAETRLGMVFVNLGGGAQPIDQHLAPMLQELDEYDLAVAIPVEDDAGEMARTGRTVASNWKTYLENAAINVLHEAFTHESYRQSPEVPRVKSGTKTYFDVARGPLMALGYELKGFAKTYGLTRDIPHLGHAPKAPPRNGYFLTYFPNVVMPIRLNMFRLNICLPERPGVTRLLHCSFVHPTVATGTEFKVFHRSLVERFHNAYQEDKVAIEAVQAARRSPAFTQHFYAPFWDVQHHHFNQLVMERLVPGYKKRPGRLVRSSQHRRRQA